MSLDERFFPQPTKFLPERWTRDGNTDVIDKGYQNFPNVIVKPFGFGVRSCAGVRVAKPTMMLSVAKVSLHSKDKSVNLATPSTM